MKKAMVIISIMLLIICGIFFAVSPDYISMIVVGVMSLVLVLGYIFGVLPNLMFSSGFIRGVKSIENLEKITTNNKWTALKQMTPIFKQNTLDKYFEQYLKMADEQFNKGLIVSDIEDVLNEDSLSLRNWRAVVIQVAGILTALGLLGTFLGLVTGIGNVSFGTFEATVISIETLLQGIATAFFTSIVGVILSVIFNITNRVVWNITLREMGLFYEKFHTHIQPLAESQISLKKYNQNEEILSILRDLRNSTSQSSYMLGENQLYEQRIMLQILSAMENGEFSVCYNPICKIADRSVYKAVANIKWNHSTLGIINYSSYEVIVKSNGYIVKLQQFVWESVAEYLSNMKKQSLHTVPIVLTAPKQFILGMDILQYISKLTQDYNLVPRDFQIAIEWDTYRDCYKEAIRIETALLELGYDVIIYNYDGDTLQLPETNIDEIIIDFNNINEDEFELFAMQLRKRNIAVTPTSVSFAKQVNIIRKSGCENASGLHLAPLMTENELSNIIN